MMMASASFEVETPTLCLECKKILNSQFISGKVYVEPHNCKISQTEERSHFADTIDNNERDSISDKYNELLMAVSNKYEGETRHETALKSIKFAESIRMAKKSETESVS